MFGIFKRKDNKGSFWDIIGLLEWKFEGDDDKVISPVEEYLSRQSDEFIFNFHEQMATWPVVTHIILLHGIMLIAIF